MLLQGKNKLGTVQARQTRPQMMIPASPTKLWKRSVNFISGASRCMLQSNDIEKECTAQTAPGLSKRELLQAALSLSLLTAAPHPAKAEGDKVCKGFSLLKSPIFK
eukprot:1149959-Pelagomonas_calceolata.AAC.4